MIIILLFSLISLTGCFFFDLVDRVISDAYDFESENPEQERAMFEAIEEANEKHRDNIEGAIFKDVEAATSAVLRGIKTAE